MNKLRKQRMRLGFTQEQVATAAGISRNLYSMYECGSSPSLPNALRVAAVLGTTVEALFGDAVLAGETAEAGMEGRDA